MEYYTDTLKALNDGTDTILDVELPVKAYVHLNDPKGEIEIHGHGVRILDWERRTFTFIKKKDIELIVGTYKKLGLWE